MDLIDLFMEYTKDLRTTKIYRKWSGITMVAGAMERRIKAPFGPYVNYPNLYVMLVGRSTTGKNVIEQVQHLWDETKDATGFPIFCCGLDDTTKAGLVDRVKASVRKYDGANYLYHCLLAAIEEFSVTFPKHDPDLLSFLTKVWNAPPYYVEQRRRSGTLRIEYPIMTLLIGYQPHLMRKIMEQGAAEQGFLSRTILVWGDKPVIKPLWDTPPLSLEIKNQICHRLAEIAAIYGEMEWTDAAKKFLQDWEDNSYSPRPTHANLEEYNGRRYQLVQKLSIIASISEGTRMVIELYQVERALEWLLEAEEVMPEIFSNAGGGADLRLITRLNAHLTLQFSLGIPITDSLIYSWLVGEVDAYKHRSIIEAMQASEYILKKPDGTWRVTGKGP